MFIDPILPPDGGLLDDLGDADGGESFNDEDLMPPEPMLELPE